jgi:hypothetical protein
LIKVTLGIVVFSLVVVLGGSFAWGGDAVPLDDAQLDQVYGGDAYEESNGGLVFNNSCESCSLNISGTQSGNSAILINAVGSTVSAQLNISVGDGSQTNVSFTNAVGATPQ